MGTCDCMQSGDLLVDLRTHEYGLECFYSCVCEGFGITVFNIKEFSLI